MPLALKPQGPCHRSVSTLLGKLGASKRTVMRFARSRKAHASAALTPAADLAILKCRIVNRGLVEWVQIVTWVRKMIQFCTLMYGKKYRMYPPHISLPHYPLAQFAPSEERIGTAHGHIAVLIVGEHGACEHSTFRRAD